MSKFIAFLCAVSMLAGTTAVFAEDAATDTETTAVNEEVTVDLADNSDDILTPFVFTDVPEDAYYAKAVDYCYSKGLFNGTTDTEFSPDAAMTRGMFATVFSRIQSADFADVVLTYADVASDAYYAMPIAWATKAGIMDGYSDTSFGPDDAITREQAAKMLYSYLSNAKNISISDVAANYTDIADTSDWASAAVNANTSIGYLLADEENNINPKAVLTRADACYAVATTTRLVELLETAGTEGEQVQTNAENAVDAADTVSE